MKMLVFGGRDFEDEEALFGFLDDLYVRYPMIDYVVHGDAAGADKLGGKWAEKHGIQEIRCPAPWKFHFKSAGGRRNILMCNLLGLADIAAQFPGGPGTAHMASILAKRPAITVHRYIPGT